MATVQLSETDLVTRMADPPSDLLECVISGLNAATLSRLRLVSRGSTLGQLDGLPVEVLHSIFVHLDLRSLARLSCVSVRCSKVVASLPMYRDLMDHAPQALTALGKTGIASIHTIATVNAAMKSQNCIGCGLYGPFLFLPTCERCCFVCMYHDESLWVIPLGLASKAFQLTARQLKTLPAVHSIPGTCLAPLQHNYGIAQIHHQRRYRLVSVKQAHQLAITVHGSIERIMETSTEVGDPPSHYRLWPTPKTMKELREVSAEQHNDDPTLIGHHVYHMNQFCGMACTMLPKLLPDRSSEKACWCYGCDHWFERLVLECRRIPPFRLSIPECGNLYTILKLRSYRARSQSELQEHVKRCAGAQSFLGKYSGQPTLGTAALANMQGMNVYDIYDKYDMYDS